jgi:hypothetical protein
MPKGATMNRRYTVSEIADIICRADGLVSDDYVQAYSQLRQALRRRMLPGGEVIDARGTLSFAPVEIYRARLINALMDFRMPLPAIEEVLPRALADVRPPLGFAGYWTGLPSVIDRVGQGEQWSLVVSLWRPGFSHGKRLTGIIVPGDGSRSEDDGILDTTFGTGAPLGRLVLDLNTLFAGLPALEG